MNFVESAPSAGSIARPVDQQSSALPLCYGRPLGTCEVQYRETEYTHLLYPPAAQEPVYSGRRSAPCVTRQNQLLSHRGTLHTLGHVILKEQRARQSCTQNTHVIRMIQLSRHKVCRFMLKIRQKRIIKNHKVIYFNMETNFTQP